MSSLEQRMYKDAWEFAQAPRRKGAHGSNVECVRRMERLRDTYRRCCISAEAFHKIDSVLSTSHHTYTGIALALHGVALWDERDPPPTKLFYPSYP